MYIIQLKIAGKWHSTMEFQGADKVLWKSLLKKLFLINYLA